MQGHFAGPSLRWACKKLAGLREGRGAIDYQQSIRSRGELCRAGALVMARVVALRQGATTARQSPSTCRETKNAAQPRSA